MTTFYIRLSSNIQQAHEFVTESLNYILHDNKNNRSDIEHFNNRPKVEESILDLNQW